MWYMWLIMAGVFIIVEIFTVGFLIFWLSIGSLFAMVTSFFTDNLIIQTTVFVISSAILMFATKPFVKKFATVKNPISTNVYSKIGKVGIVTQEIDNIKAIGQIKLEGEVWSAISSTDSTIPINTKVVVKKIEGVKAVVEPN
ncbi:MAG: NfeD family protein [Clostridia bacterium]|nr:NfeD family protein [Clostridia bacterium]